MTKELESWAFLQENKGIDDGGNDKLTPAFSKCGYWFLVPNVGHYPLTCISTSIFGNLVWILYPEQIVLLVRLRRFNIHFQGWESFSKILSSCAEKLLSVATVLLCMHCAYTEYYHCKFHFTVATGGDCSFVQCVLGEHNYNSLLLLFQCYQSLFCTFLNR